MRHISYSDLAMCWTTEELWSILFKAIYSHRVLDNTVAIKSRQTRQNVLHRLQFIDMFRPARPQSVDQDCENIHTALMETEISNSHNLYVNYT
jgi:hypothetical protein